MKDNKTIKVMMTDNNKTNNTCMHDKTSIDFLLPVQIVKYSRTPV